MQKLVAFVLPPSESFSAARTGAIGLLVHRLAAHPGRYRQLVLGPPVADPPLPDVEFLPVRPSWLPGPRARRYAAGVAAALRRISPALVEVHNRPDVALLLARTFPTLPVALVLNNDPTAMRQSKTPSARAELLRRLAFVACSSSWLAARLTDGVAAPARPPVVLPNSLGLASLPPPAARRDPVILFAGRVVRDKGADTFIDAAALALPRLPGWRAEMIGGDRFGPDSPETDFIRAVRPRAERGGIVMHGWRPHADVVAAMARAAIVVVPSRWPEPFGLTSVEAMASGAALLCSNRGGLAEVVGDAAMPIDPDDPAAMAAAFIAIASDPDRRAALAAAGLARARRFDVPVIAAQLETLRDDVLGAWSRRPGAAI